MDLLLRGKRALVTGSTAGIGEGIARALAAEGASVVVHGRNEEEARRVVDDIARLAPAAVALGDLSRDDELERVAEEAIAAFDGIDILVNNALQYGGANWFDVTADDWVHHYRVVVVAAARLAGWMVPGMQERRWGRVIQIGSTAGATAFAMSPHYGAAKAALVNLSASLSKELGASGITSNTVSPGPIATATIRSSIARAKENAGNPDMSDHEFFDILATRPYGGMMWNPLHRFGRVEEVAALVTFVASPLAGFINGANLRIDGGVVPTINP